MGDDWINKQLSKFAQNFDEADTDKSNSLSFRELAFSLVKGGYKGSFSETRNIFKNLDTDGDKKISKQEYLDRIKSLPPKEIKEMCLRREFKLIDADGSGSLNRKEITDAICNAELDPASENISNLLTSLDADPDKKLNYEEFLAAWSSQH